MININEARLIGRLAADPTFGTSGRGQEYMRVRVITSRSYRDQNDKWQEVATGHSVVTFDKYRIQHGRERLRKGMLVLVEGENNESRREVDGEIVYSRGILVPMRGRLHALESREANSRDQSGETGRAPAGGDASSSSHVPDGPPINGQNPIDQHTYDDEIPF
ncbi:single-stranded DNA-binding protein [uncultured Tateyamaria sp.]|uniref:single-stranded DNA-binding protein n=1 Tax=uncultured Tateyamaria sp. TaxID=455651 RepID=UPI00261E67A0|nr:single-stranded DNA-binding protein [uncultured Tateyamaria sp.]